MRVPVRLYVILLLLGCAPQAFAQPAFAQRGAIMGITADSVHHYSLRSATVAVYDATDSSRLFTFGLTDNFGKFQLTNIPLDTIVRLVISYTGYDDRVKILVLDHDHPTADLGKLYLLPDTQSLARVEVHWVQPIRMNHDTLEFNPRAFSLDKNAVVEDLLRRLPGVTVWGDGTISVNGHTVKSVLVDGKPFFGGDTRIATQNIPKGSVDRIQVYQQNKDPSRPFDSVTEVNIKLKKNSNHGLFGKISAGYGTDDRKEADASVNFFTPRSQLALIGAGNNVNKTAPDVNTLMENSTFKGMSAAIDYTPDLRSPGETRPIEAGATFQHDFINTGPSRETDRLSGDYFLAKRQNHLLTNTTTTTGITNGTTLVQKEAGQNDSSSTRQDGHAKYEYAKSAGSYSVLGSLESNNAAGRRTSSVVTTGQQGDTLSSSSLDLDADERDKTAGTLITIGQTAEISFAGGDGHSNKALVNKFSSNTGGAARSFNRRYALDSTWWSSRLFLTTRNLTSLRVRGWKIAGLDVQNELTLHGRHLGNSVNDVSGITHTPVSNGYLTATNNYFELSETPALRLSRGWSANLSGRYVRTFNLDVFLKEQWYAHRNTSTHDFQHFQHTWREFTPEIRLQRRNYQLGRYDNNWLLSIGTSYSYPAADQLTALADSADPYHLYRGNLLLGPSQQQELVLSFTHESYKPGQPYNYNLLLKAGVTRDCITDSSQTSNDGSNTDYPVNGSDYRYVRLNAHLGRSVKLREHTLEFSVSDFGTIFHSPSYINNLLTVSNGFDNAATATIGYTLRDRLAVVASQTISIYRSALRGASDDRFQNTTNSTGLSVSWVPLKAWTIKSDVTYNDYASSGARSLTFTMWNASTSYRLLKADNAELKLSAFDLLHQNSGFINRGSRNMLVLGKTNALQQYFMLTIAWFPRKFGH